MCESRDDVSSKRKQKRLDKNMIRNEACKERQMQRFKKRGAHSSNNGI